MDMDKRAPDHGGMAYSRRTKGGYQQPQRRSRPLYIGQWIRALGLKQVEVVRATGINEGYLSELCGGKTTKVPSSAVLADIAESLKIPVDYLYRLPPDQAFIDQATSLDPAVLARLRRQ